MNSLHRSIHRLPPYTTHPFKRRLLLRLRSISSSTEEDITPDFRPHRIILLRHGESQGNVDQNAYVTTADWRIPITEVGRGQAAGESVWCDLERERDVTHLKLMSTYCFIWSDAGKRLREKIVEPDAKVLFYFSPYLRTKQVSQSCICLLSQQWSFWYLQQLGTYTFIYLQTLDEILPFFCEKDILGIMEEPRIRYDLKMQICILFSDKYHISTS